MLDIRSIFMKTTYSITQAQSQLPAIVRSVCEEGGVYTIASRGEARAYLVSRERMESLLETLEILGSPKAVGAIRSYEQGEMTFRSLDEL